MDVIPATPGGADSGYRALVVDDEKPLAEVVASYLQRERFEVTVCHSGAAALEVARDVDPDVVVLDLGLPGIDGLEVCRQLRTFSDAYVVMLTARDTEVDTIVGLSVGADDYVTKPFSMGELLARVRVALRHRARGADGEDSVVRVEGVAIDLGRRVVTRDGAEVRLTPIEYRLLALLARHAGRVLTHAQLLREVWGPGYAAQHHYVRVYMAQLRAKLERDPARPAFLVTEPGVGYRLREP